MTPPDDTGLDADLKAEGDRDTSRGSVLHPGSFGLHALAWFLFYAAVVIAWGQRNSWPDDLVISVFLMPLNVLAASTLYTAYGFGRKIAPDVSHQEQLIAALILAVGLASGQLLLMSLGLAALGVAWLRPARHGVEWAEWLKVPLIFLTALPFWLDFRGSSFPLWSLFEDPHGNPVYALPLALQTTQTRMLGYCGMMAMVLTLRGRVFWMSLPGLPLFLAGVASLPDWVPGWDSLSASLRQVLAWLAGILGLAIVAWLGSAADRLSSEALPGDRLRRWFEQRRYPPWIAVVVIALTQTTVLGGMAASSDTVTGLVGVGILGLVLLGLRLRTPKGPIHSRSVSIVAGALALTWVAEFMAAENMKLLAIGFVLIGLLSWHCFWSLRVLGTAVAAAVCLLGTLPPQWAAAGTSQGFHAIRIVLAAVLLVALFWLGRRSLPLPGQQGYDESGWVPPKRFALILLGLMILFQMASAFWPDHEMEARGTLATPGDVPDRNQMQTTGQAVRYRIRDVTGEVQFTVAHGRIPYFIEPPEPRLRKMGWKVVRRERLAHPLGEALALQAERDGRRVTTLWWFEQGSRAFIDHGHARRVLWSGWYLADRELRLVRVESIQPTEPADLAAFAARHGWFASLPSTPASTLSRP